MSFLRDMRPDIVPREHSYLDYCQPTVWKRIWLGQESGSVSKKIFPKDLITPLPRSPTNRFPIQQPRQFWFQSVNSPSDLHHRDFWIQLGVNSNPRNLTSSLKLSDSGGQAPKTHTTNFLAAPSTQKTHRGII